MGGKEGAAGKEEEEEVMGGKELAAVAATATCVGVMIAGLIFLIRENITLFVYAATNETTDRTAAVVAVGAELAPRNITYRYNIID